LHVVDTVEEADGRQGIKFRYKIGHPIIAVTPKDEMKRSGGDTQLTSLSSNGRSRSCRTMCLSRANRSSAMSPGGPRMRATGNFLRRRASL
jgi:hypothetical protein